MTERTAAGLTDGHAQVWVLPIPAAPDTDRLAAAAGLLSGEERARAARFHFDRDRASFILSHALVRDVLSRYAAVAPRDWTFRVNEHGCPFIAEPAACDRLRFNLSHADGCAAVVVARDRDVGIDVESLARRAVDVDLAERYFAPAEVKAVRQAPPERRHQVFLEIWTLKEAYIKARGVGLSLGLQEFTCIPGEGESAVAFVAPLQDDPAGWYLRQLAPTPAHVGAVAVRRTAGRDVIVEIRQLDEVW